MNKKIITISDAAKQHIQGLIKKTKNKKSFLRVSIQGGGCAGFTYHFDFDDKAQKGETTIKSGTQILVAIDKTSLSLMNDAEIDYVDELGGSFFKINNPNAASSCGCGVSFAPKEIKS